MLFSLEEVASNVSFTIDQKYLRQFLFTSLAYFQYTYIHIYIYISSTIL